MHHPISVICHTEQRQPLLSSHVTTADLWGFAHLLCAIFVATNCREIVANVLKYGIVVRWIPTYRTAKDNPVLLTGILICSGIACGAYLIERKRARQFQEHLRKVEDAASPKAVAPDDAGTPTVKLRRQKVEAVVTPVAASGAGLIERRFNEILESVSPIVMLKLRRIAEEHVEYIHVLRVTGLVVAEMALPYLIVTHSHLDPVSSLALLMFSVTLTLKIISYCHVLHDIRVIKLAGIDFEEVCPNETERKLCEKYPESSADFREYFTYLWMPTLCYQLHYPKKPRREWRQIGKVSLQLFFSCVVMKILVEQYMSIILVNAFSFDLTDVSPGRLLGHIIERLLKLSIPTLYCWLLMFLSFFHYWMLLLAEITRYADAYFYDDWWNATGFAEYWRKWNLPVHKFCSRHVYKPLIKRKVPRFVAGQIVFLLSAVFHEYLVVAPLRLRWTGLVCLAFIIQTPLALITDTFLGKNHPTAGNIAFWVAFCFTGQPIGVLLFYYLWHMKTGTIHQA